MKTAIQNALEQLGNQQPLPAGTISKVMHQIMDGDATAAQIGGLLMALKISGETVEQISEAAAVMRERAIKVKVSDQHLIDTCGTGGDGIGTFNVSTAAAFIAAAAGCRVAKHGNRSISSSTGSADVLEAAGVNLELTPEQVAACIEQFNIGFLFAPAHHGATKHAVMPRKELAVRTFFNLLGPLTNPAQAPRQVMGIFDQKWLLTAAQVLQKLGSKHVMVVHSADGMDEISLNAETAVAELKNGKITEYSITPEQFGFTRNDMQSLLVENAAQSLNIIEQTLQGQKGPAHDILALNAGAAIYIADKAPDLASGIETAKQIMTTGKAYQLLVKLAKYTQGIQL